MKVLGRTRIVLGRTRVVLGSSVREADVALEVRVKTVIACSSYRMLTVLGSIVTEGMDPSIL